MNDIHGVNATDYSRDDDYSDIGEAFLPKHDIDLSEENFGDEGRLESYPLEGATSEERDSGLSRESSEINNLSRSSFFSVSDGSFRTSAPDEFSNFTINDNEYKVLKIDDKGLNLSDSHIRLISRLWARICALFSSEPVKFYSKMDAIIELNAYIRALDQSNTAASHKIDEFKKVEIAIDRIKSGGILTKIEKLYIKHMENFLQTAVNNVVTVKES